MVFAKTTERSGKETGPTPGDMAAFKAMDEFTEELVKAGIFLAAADLKNNGEARRIVFDGAGTATSA